ncbi:DUF192 domain-containing protein [uncultured Adlercreutzia sp.]|uniref:DUF192 domain-containing protein n=1 Tax=uncultured Adlercreutzia sp. TaxID=875803 RepID=UPI0026F3EFC2|nr:DUF192 domain-containing protein [uncultured Adlercreutzia sp.]
MEGRRCALVDSVQLHRYRRRVEHGHSSSGRRVFRLKDGAEAPFGGTWVVATRPLMRLRGLAGRAPDATTLVFPRCRDVHTITMRHRLDIAFLDRRGRVLGVHRQVPPGRRLRNRKARAVVERFARPGPWLRPGDCCRGIEEGRSWPWLERRLRRESVSRVRKHAVR